MRLTTLLLLSVLTSGIVFASSSNWSEVTRFTGSGTTDYFTCEHVEWRIRWEYIPSSTFPGLAMFGVFTYEAGEDVMYIDFISQMGFNETSGVSYIHNKEGTFYMDISTANTEGFTVIVEQDLNSIPEFPSWIILPLFLIVTVLALVFRKRLYRIIS